MTTERIAGKGRGNAGLLLAGAPETRLKPRGVAGPVMPGPGGGKGAGS